MYIHQREVTHFEGCEIRYFDVVLYDILHFAFL